MCKALNALTGLTELGLLQKSTLYDFTADIVVFLCHPVSNRKLVHLVGYSSISKAVDLLKESQHGM